MDVKPGGYYCRKWTVFTLCMVNIIAVVSVAITVIRVNSDIIDNKKNAQKKNLEQFEKEAIIRDWKTCKTVLIVSSCIMVLIHILGLVAILKEHLCLVVTYTFLTFIQDIIYLIAKIQLAPIFLILFILSLFLTIFSFIYCLDINRWRRQSGGISYITNNVIINSTPQLPQQTYPNTYFHSRSNSNQIYPGPIYTNQVYPSPAYNNQIYTNPVHPNPYPTQTYPVQLQTGQQGYNEETVIIPLRPMCYQPSSSAPPPPPPYDFREKTLSIDN